MVIWGHSKGGYTETYTEFALCDTVDFMKIIVAAAKFCRRDQSHEFKLVWIRATNRIDKISESSVVAACVHFRQQVAATKYKWTNEGASYGQPCWIRKLVHIPLHMRLLRVHRTDIVSQRLVTSAEGEVKDSRCSGMCQSCHFWQDWASKVCMFSVLFGYLTKWEPN